MARWSWQRGPALGLLACCMAYIFCTIFWFRPVPVDGGTPPGGDPHASSPYRNVPLATNRSAVSGAAFAFLALGAQSNQMNCGAAIESLVKYGGWGGEVYLITDRQQCFDPKAIVANANMDARKLHLVQADEDYSSGGVDLLHFNVGARKSRVRSLETKMRLFEYVTDPSINTLAYVDCDVLFGQSGCASQFVATGPAWDDAKIRISQASRDEHGALQDVHVGSFVVHREHSKELLRLWRERMATRLYEGDNDAFMSVYQQFQREGLGAANPMEPAVVLRYGTDASDGDARFERFSKGAPGSFACINHLSKRRCQEYGREHIQRYVDQFHLKTYAAGQQYCMSSWVQTLAYGWFPLGSLPGCPKLETLL